MQQEGVRKEMIYTGNCLDILPTLDAEAVQLDTDVVQFFAPQVKGIASVVYVIIIMNGEMSR